MREDKNFLGRMKLNQKISNSIINKIIEYEKLRESLPYKIRILNRIKWLVNSTLNYSEESINPDSVNLFLRFMKLKKGFKYPDIFLSPLGNITIRWKIDNAQKVIIEFVSEQNIRLVVFASNLVTETVSFNNLWDTIELHKCKEWIMV